MPWIFLLLSSTYSLSHVLFTADMLEKLARVPLSVWVRGPNCTMPEFSSHLQHSQPESHSLLSLMILETESSTWAAVLVGVWHDSTKMTEYHWLERSATIHWAEHSPRAVGQSTASQSWSSLRWLQLSPPVWWIPSMLVLGSCTTTLLFTVREQTCTKEAALQGHQSKPGASNQLPSPAITEKF